MIILLFKNFSTTHKIILMYMPEIAMRTPSSSRIFTKHDMFNCVSEIFNKHRIRKGATFIGHSFGTVIMAWFLNERKEFVNGCYFLDPVCFRLNEPDVCFNFMYRTPQNAIQLIFSYFAGKELGISTVLSRHFWWYIVTIIIQVR